VPEIFHWGQDRRIEGPERDWGSCGGAETHPHQLWGLGERRELRQRDRPKVFHYFQHSGWGGVLGEGAETPPRQIWGLGERRELRQRDRPKVFHYFQHSGWPLLTL